MTASPGASRASSQERWLFLGALWRLGVSNLSAVALHRLAIRSGVMARLTPVGQGYGGTFFQPPACPLSVRPDPSVEQAVLSQAEELIQGSLILFSRHKFQLGSPPKWFCNPLNMHRCPSSAQHWSRVVDFDASFGDIKCCWEASRFDWALTFAKAMRLSGEGRYLDHLNNWVADWTMANPLNHGVNWKCGQETSIRLQHVLLAGYLLGAQEQPQPALQRFAREHCQRISATLGYAKAQDNNHGTSEAAALFVGGAWLELYANQPNWRRQGRSWCRQGRTRLEERVKKLVQVDGSFSQHSLNYHRVLVDTLNLTEFWRRSLGQAAFSERFYRRGRAAIEWLYQLVDPRSGEGPNLGANDGARLFVLSELDYLDFRPTIQLGGVLFFGGRLYPAGAWDEPLFWLGAELSPASSRVDIPRKCQEFTSGGYVVLHGDDQAWGVLRYPRYRFRPGHADAMHFDLWSGGKNLLRDSGSYSYFCEEPWKTYFASTAAHNTVEFDGRDQMPKVGHFLRGGWLQMQQVFGLAVHAGEYRWSGTYRDYRGCSHSRSISVKGNKWQVVDRINGFGQMAVLRWRLAPGDWQLYGNRCSNGKMDLTVDCDRTKSKIQLVTGWESRYYLEKSELPVLEVRVEPGATLLTTDIVLRG